MIRLRKSCKLLLLTSNPVVLDSTIIHCFTFSCFYFCFRKRLEFCVNSKLSQFGRNYFAKKAKTSEKSENISKAKIVLMFSQNSELDCVDSFCFRKVDLLFCEIISKPRNPRIWCNFQFAKMNCNNIECFNKVPQWPPNSWPPRSLEAVWINLTIFLYFLVMNSEVIRCCLNKSDNLPT